MMAIINTLLLAFAILISPLTAQECNPRDVCDCVFDDGQGYDLKPVVEGDTFLEAFADENRTFFYHPCGDTKKLPVFSNMTMNECAAGYMLCMYDKKNNTTHILGEQAYMGFKSNGDQMQVIFTKTAESIESSILLECTPQSKNSVLYAPPTVGSDQYNLVLYSKHGCKVQIDPDNHHGFFYTLFIVFLTLLFTYLFLGMMINYFFIGARGFELIPNYDFWCKAKTSVTLAFAYVKNGGRVIPNDDSYDAI